MNDIFIHLIYFISFSYEYLDNTRRCQEVE